MIGGPVVERFPLFVPPGFQPSDVDGDGPDRNAAGRICPGYGPLHVPRWGGGFDAPRGPRRLPHHAIDIMAAEGVLVRAIAGGRVLETITVRITDPKTKAVVRRTMPGAGTSAKGGHYVYLADDRGWRWYFAHLRNVPLVRPGQIVTAGHLLGYVGRTGNAVRRVVVRDKVTNQVTRVWRGCPHLHLSLTDPKGRKVDSVPLLRELFDAGDWQEP